MPSLGRQASLGSSLLFPGAQPAGLSPMLAASPGGPMPFSTTMTPGLTQAQRSDAQAATTTTPGNPLTAFKSPSVRFAGNTPAPPKTAPARQMPQSALSAELPPLHSLLDAIGPSSVAPPRAADPCAAPAPATEAASATGAQPVPAAVTASRAEGSAAMGAATAAGAMGGRDVGGSGGELWVTVFGYPSSAMLPMVLDEMRPSGGELVRHRAGVGPKDVLLPLDPLGSVLTAH